MKKVSINGFKIKIQKICVKLGVPIQVFISLGTPNYRKPYVGMWELLERAENDGVPIDRALSLYVGDAAGRLRTPTRTRPDHSLADRLFAANLGVPFRTPEQFFLKRMEDEPFKLPSFCSATLLKDANAKNRLFEPASARFPMADVEVVVLVGPPASGKSTLAARLSTWHDYAIVNQDELKTAAACSQRVAQLLANRRRVIVDNTNRDPETRRRYVELAREAGVPCRCVLMDCSVDQAIHNNLYRKITGMADEKHKYVNDMVVRMFYNEFKMPTLEEGFTDLVHANFLPDFNGDEERRRIFAMYLIEK